jgi:hypothetical protein
MRKMAALVVAIGLGGCGGGDEPPSCQQAVTHFYEAGCMLVDANGTPFTALEVIENCKGLLGAAPDQCLDDLDNLRSCFGSVKSPAMTNADCDCSAEQDAILTCE